MNKRIDVKCPCCDEYLAFVGQQVYPSGKVNNMIHCTNEECALFETTHTEGETLKSWQAWGSPRKNGAA